MSESLKTNHKTGWVWRVSSKCKRLQGWCLHLRDDLKSYGHRRLWGLCTAGQTKKRYLPTEMDCVLYSLLIKVSVGTLTEIQRATIYQMNLMACVTSTQLSLPGCQVAMLCLCLRCHICLPDFYKCWLHFLLLLAFSKNICED